MENLLWLIPALPFLGATLLVLFGTRLSKTLAAVIGVGSVGVSALITLLLGIGFLSARPAFYHQEVWQWFSVADFNPSIAFHLDALSMVFIFVITFVGFLIHLYATAYMADEPDFSRFFACMNLFVGSMLVLVMADNLLLLYLGWEGVGLCSYLLIGFWYKEPANGYAARKAFIITRVGDTAMAIGLFMLFQLFGTLNIQTILAEAPEAWAVGSQMAVIVALLLLGGAVGKSGQLPLQTWLPDAMAGPTPVSALIHAATMVTAGVYLIARMYVVFELAPVAQLTVAIVGAVTLLLAGFSALTQYDLKRVLAYSTISQIGYMFLALGVGAWSAGIFHFMIHAFFKALLFLCAGAIILTLHHEQDMRQMGGLRKSMPVVFWTFLIGAASLAALPLITAGFYSKDQILWYTLAGPGGNVWLYAAGLAGAFITSIYTFRMVFMTFYGESKTHVSHPPGKRITVPLIILAILSVVGGFIELPHNFGHVVLFSDLLAPVLPGITAGKILAANEWLFQLLAALFSLGGVFVAYLFYLKSPSLLRSVKRSGTAMALHRFWHTGWGFDALYNTLFVQPYVYLSNINKRDVIDSFYTGLARVAEGFHVMFSQTQNGILRNYVMGIVVGAIMILTISLLL
ncbi:NADH dehydrogenase subunit L [Pontibacter ummariensis]|uniref:NADH dehydrogenase subunit L n=1 Tax=Pontibacter ummariensis TaxID=1610492 RepID=A0A239GLP9_9BACT|nr:NADH-quinone oxidoreductase subunit L [Pontibacter ummariensis]PRY11323.1 NADH dehydrogenase subunit L [Pontibacter ummariensis]SNS69815.1 NADH dehydrogenase subunit L [Pontibacter ummariensis]